MGLFTPRLAKRRSQRNRWQRVTSLPDDPRPVHAFSFAEENNNKEDARTGMEQCVSYLARICNFVDDRDKNIDSLFDAVLK